MLHYYIRVQRGWPLPACFIISHPVMKMCRCRSLDLVMLICPQFVGILNQHSLRRALSPTFHVDPPTHCLLNSAQLDTWSYPLPHIFVHLVYRCPQS